MIPLWADGELMPGRDTDEQHTRCSQLVLGLGNALRGDDGVGPAVIDAH